MIPPPPGSKRPDHLLPDTTLFRSVLGGGAGGGAGASLGDIAAIAEAAGRHALAEPLVERCAVTPALLSRIVGNPAADALLSDIASGEADRKSTRLNSSH